MKEIELSNSDKVALVSDEDYDYLNQFQWKLYIGKTTFYPERYLPVINRNKDIQSKIRMYNDIGERIGIIGLIDHKDRNGLNNQRENLRPATRSQNQMNQGIRIDNISGYKGVTFHKLNNRWMAQITRRSKVICLGYFDDPIKAAEAYDRAARRLHGDFAVLNFPGG